MKEKLKEFFKSSKGITIGILAVYIVVVLIALVLLEIFNKEKCYSDEKSNKAVGSFEQQERKIKETAKELAMDATSLKLSMRKITNKNSEGEEALYTKNNILDSVSLEELVMELEERTKEPTMDTICIKLESYAKGLNDEIKYGVITLSEEEMKVLREYVRNNFNNAGKMTQYQILRTNDIITGLGTCQYKEYKFVLELRRQLTFIGPEDRKQVTIANSIDHPDDNTIAYARVSDELSDGYRNNKRFDLINKHEACYTYYRDEKSIIIEKWKFDEKLDEWRGDAWQSDNIWYGSPKVFSWNEEKDQYVLIAESRLLLARDKKITVLAHIDWDTEVGRKPGEDTVLFYIENEELHQVDINTLEDKVVTEEYPEIFENLS